LGLAIIGGEQVSTTFPDAVALLSSFALQQQTTDSVQLSIVNTGNDVSYFINVSQEDIMIVRFSGLSAS